MNLTEGKETEVKLKELEGGQQSVKWSWGCEEQVWKGSEGRRGGSQENVTRLGIWDLETGGLYRMFKIKERALELSCKGPFLWLRWVDAPQEVCSLWWEGEHPGPARSFLRRTLLCSWGLCHVPLPWEFCIKCSWVKDDMKKNPGKMWECAHGWKKACWLFFFGDCYLFWNYVYYIIFGGCFQIFSFIKCYGAEISNIYIQFSSSWQ